MEVDRSVLMVVASSPSIIIGISPLLGYDDNPHQFVITDTDDEGNNNIPVIDLSLNDEAVAQDIFDAATKWGFFQITNHGLDQHLIDEMFDVNRRFMALDDTTKAMYKFDRKAICGYEKATQ
eukprot:scaffold16936_cov101-Skeletonema_dohrnii-CCMP3373.AAC.1